MQLDSLHVVVTGAASGMGRHFALRLAESGARVAALDVDESGLAALADAAASLDSGSFGTWVCDVADETSVANAFAGAAEAFGPVNGLINNAGLFRDALLVKRDRKTGALRTMSLADWQKVIDVDLTGPFLCTRELASRAIEAEVGPAVVVNISSVSRHGNPGQSNYSAAKAGLIADTALWAKELARYKIRVGAVAPGFIATPILDGMRPDALEKVVSQVPLRRVGQPEEIWQAVRFVIECDYFTGRCVDVDGGLTL